MSAVMVAPPRRPQVNPPKHQFRSDIEGLRGFAVLAVVLFHANFPGITGGFVGVDVFFVISGFLITGMLWRELSTTGSIRLGHFFGARARRLLPAGVLVLAVTAVASYVFLPPLQIGEVLGDAIASALYVGNYRLAIRGTDYLAAGSPPSTFQHFWSLGVEEQFYFVWPALMIGMAYAVLRWRRRTVTRTDMVGLLVFVAAISFAVCLYWTTSSRPWAYFSLPSRAWELAAGGLIALSAPLWGRLSRDFAAVVGGLGLTLLVVSCFRFDSQTAFPGLAALLPITGTALVLGAGCASVRHGAGRVLSAPVLRSCGRISYAWYLWHWPLLVIAAAMVGHPLGWIAGLPLIAVSAGLATATLRMVENPVRFAPALRHSARRSLIVGGGLTGGAVALALILLATASAPVGSGAAAAPMKLPDSPVSAVSDLTADVQKVVAESAQAHAVPKNLSPTLAHAPVDKPDVFVNGCVRSWRDVGQSTCATGDLTSKFTVALIGDSHAAMWNPAYEILANQQHWRLETLAKITCPLLDLPISSPYLGRDYTECKQWRGQIVDRLKAEKPQVIVLDMSRRYGRDFGFAINTPQWYGAITKMVADLKTTGAKVIVLGSVPDPHSTVPTCVSAHLSDATACAPARSKGVNDAASADEGRAVTAGGGAFVDLTPLFCTDQQCPVIIGNNLVFRDDNHITIEYAEAVAPVIGSLTLRAIR